MTVLDPDKKRKSVLLVTAEDTAAKMDTPLSADKKQSHRQEAEEMEEEEESDPFSHRIKLSLSEWARTLLLSLTLLPLRFLCVLVTVTLAWAICSVALLGLTEEQKTRKPLLGWRRRCRLAASYLGRISMIFSGFSVTVRGRRVSPDEAPILVAAPHSTFFDAFATFWSDLPYIVNREENRSLPLFGKCIECAQALFVSREDPLSRQKTIREIGRRAASEDPWPQLIIFPEGSTSNRKALLTFKNGAFYPAKPVQPVVLRYPNVLDTVTWTWNQSHGALAVICLTLSQPFTRAEIEFLPVYHPSEAEKEDAALFARNVRKTMAAALGVDVTDATYEEAKAKFGKKRRGGLDKKVR